MTGVVGSFILSDITYTFLWSSSHTIILYPYICIKRDSEGKKKVGKRKQMQNRSSNDTNRALNNGVKKDIVQFHPLVSIIYLHIISRSRSIKGWSNHYHHYQYYTPLNQLYRRIATCIYNVYRRRWAIHGTTFRIIIRSEYKNLILRKGIIHEWNVSFNKRKKDTGF